MLNCQCRGNGKNRLDEIRQASEPKKVKESTRLLLLFIFLKAPSRRVIGTTETNYCNGTCNTIPDMEANSDQYACTPCELSALAAATDVVNKVLDPPKSTQLPAKLPGMAHLVPVGVGCTCKTVRGKTLICCARKRTKEKNWPPYRGY